jgi:hypothetical protein
MSCRPSPPRWDSSQADSRPRPGRSVEIWLPDTTGRSGAHSCDSEIDVNIAPLRPSDCSVIYGAILSADVSPRHVTRQMHYVGILGGPGAPGVLLITSRCNL